jgi:hypothetical protein
MRKALVVGSLATVALLAWPSGEAKAQMYFSFGNAGYGYPGYYSPGLSFGLSSYPSYGYRSYYGSPYSSVYRNYGYNNVYRGSYNSGYRYGYGGYRGGNARGWRR